VNARSGALKWMRKTCVNTLTDALRLSPLFAPATRISISKKIAEDMTRFLAMVAADTAIDPKTLQLGNVTIAELVARIAQAYSIELPTLASGSALSLTP